MKNFSKIIQPYNGQTSGGRHWKAYVRIIYTDGILSMSGVEGPISSGNCLGSCGQIMLGVLRDSKTLVPAKGWTKAMVSQLITIWDLYHLNDLRPECEHQRLLGWTSYYDHPGEVCPICGYKLGHSWKRLEVPEDVLQILQGYPDSTTEPAWI